MLAIWTRIQEQLASERGASLVEYALLVVLIAIVAILAIQFAGGEVSSTFSEIVSELQGTNERYGEPDARTVALHKR